MKVLWFANTSSNFAAGDNPYNGGGWVSSLETEISPHVELAVAFLTRQALDPRQGVVHSSPGSRVAWSRVKRHGVAYYPIYNGHDRSRADRMKTLFRGEARQEFDLVANYISVVEDFAPDIIQVFGSEHSFGLVSEHTDVPVVLHVQGIMNPYFKAFLPPGVSWGDYIFDSLKPGCFLHRLFIHERWKEACRREQRILRAIGNYLGRTAWDHEQVRQFNPSARFFEGGEIMRQPFYDADIEAISDIPTQLTLVTTISEPTYKGYDLVLRTGKLLKEKYGLPFTWQVFGNVDPGFFERVTGIRTEQAGITLAGVASAQQLVEAIAAASLYVHPSYIDNSPNGVCEAQLLGAAVVATRVGGVPSLIEDGVTGFLVRPGNPEEMAERIVAMYRNKELLRRVGANARRVALVRHDRRRIADDLLGVYRELTGLQKDPA
ncbi:MAG: glycosyltransferase [Bacteroidales bacterium]|nr:glycosyltransferase [Bacteroidales bacterium]